MCRPRQDGVPAQEQAVSTCDAFLIGERTKRRSTRSSVQSYAEAAPDAQIAVELGGEAHCASPATGQGCAMERSPSISSRAYIMVDARERWRSTSPTSSSDAPARTMLVARL